MANDRFPKFHYDITYHVIDDYDLLVESNPDCAGYLSEIKDMARKEIINAKDEVPFLKENFTTEDDTEMLDALVALVGEDTLYKIHIETEQGKIVQYITMDNLILFPATIIVNILGIVNHWADSSLPGKIKVFLHPRWKGNEEFYGSLVTTLNKLVTEMKVLDGVSEIEYYFDKEN